MKAVPVYSLRLVKEQTIRISDAVCEHDGHARRAIRSLIADRDREHLVVLFLGPKNDIRGMHVAAIGNQSDVAVTIREVFKAAIVASASGVILGHNHPSGDPTPSHSDKVFAAKATDAGALLGIPVIDHVIVTDETSVSFATAGAR